MNDGLEFIDKKRKNGEFFLSEHDSKYLLELYEIPITKEILVESEDEIKKGFSDSTFEFPVVMKVDSPDIQHKTEAGTVKVGVQNQNQAFKVYREIIGNARRYKSDARIKGILIQEMIKEVVAECIVGLKYDEQFGPVVMFGSGGIMVELFEDVSFRLPPFDSIQAEEMMQEVKGYKLLKGFRGKPCGDIFALKHVLVKMSDLAMDLNDEISEIDINPLCVLKSGSGVKAVDALVRLRDK